MVVLGKTKESLTMTPLLNRIVLKLVFRSRPNIWLGRLFFKNDGGYISNLIGTYIKSRDPARAKKNGFQAENLSTVATLKKQGFLVEDCTEQTDTIFTLAEAWSRYAEKQSAPTNGRLELSSADQSNELETFIPLLESLITPRVKNTLESFFQSHFRIINYHLYRNSKPNELKPQDAYGATANWHTDGSTSESIKLFFMLSDVTANNGPMEIMSIKDTEKVIQSGHFSYPDRRGATTNFVKQFIKTKKLQGSAGTSFYALTNNILHRATVPEDGEHRDLIVFYITSSSQNRSVARQLREAKYREVYGFERLFMD